MCREEADLIGDGREFQRRVLVKSGETVPGRRAALDAVKENGWCCVCCLKEI